MPKTPPLVLDGNLLTSVFGSSSSSEPRSARAPHEDWLPLEQGWLKGHSCLPGAASSLLPLGLVWSLAGVPKTPSLVFDGNLLASIFGSSSSSEPQPAWASREDGLVSGVALAPSPLPRGGTPLRAPYAAPEVEDEEGRAFELERGWSMVRHELF